MMRTGFQGKKEGKMYKRCAKVLIIITATMLLSGCGLLLIFNPPTETGYYPTGYYPHPPEGPPEKP